MSYLTYLEIKQKVNDSHDLEDEVFIDEAEMMGYCNDAIRRVEAQIHKIYEDYFLNSANLTLTSGSEEVDLPTDLYANKIRSIVYRDGTRVFEIKRSRSQNKFLDIEESKISPSDQPIYRYWIRNATPTLTGRKIMLIPRAAETTSTKVTMYYLRRAVTVTAETDYVDIPEFYSVIVAYMRYKAYLKEGHPNTAVAMTEFEAEEKNMIETLTEMVPDGDNEVQIHDDPYADSEC
jgi:hypothetical protein